MSEREKEDGPTAAATVSGAGPAATIAVDERDVGTASGDATTMEGSAAVIDGEWYEIRQAEQRRTRADRWLAAHNIPPLSAVDGSPTNPPPISTEAPPPEVIDVVPPRFVGPWADRPLVDEAVIPLPPPTPENPPALGPPQLLALNPPIATTTPVPPLDLTARWIAEPAAIPAALQEPAQWVAWRYEESGGRRTKVPYTPRDGRRARTNDPHTWDSAADAQAALADGGYDGVGFMLHTDDPFVGVDLDHCFDPQTGALLPWAAEIVKTLDSYTEVSPSGTGVHIFTRGSLPPRDLGRREGPVEMYSDRRFLSMTGQHLAGTPTTVEERGPALAQVHRQVFGRRYAALTAPPAPVAAPASGAPPVLPDAAILDKVQRATNGPSFERLWQGDTEGYASASEADLALCGMLAFYTQDPAQIERLVEQSGLWDEKWRNRPAYRQGTIQQAIAHRSGTYSGRRPGNAVARVVPPRRPPSSTQVTTDTARTLLEVVEDDEKSGVE